MLQRQIAKLARRAGVGFLLPCSIESPPPTSRLKPTSCRFRRLPRSSCRWHADRYRSRRDHYRGFELTRQVGLTKDRSSSVVATFSWSSQISAYARYEATDAQKSSSPTRTLPRAARLVRVRGAEYVTVHVVSCRRASRPTECSIWCTGLTFFFRCRGTETSGGWSGECCHRWCFTGKFIDRLPLFGGDHATRQRQRNSIAWRGSSFCSARSARCRGHPADTCRGSGSAGSYRPKAAGQTVV